MKVFHDMVKTEIFSNQFIVASALNSCSELEALDKLVQDSEDWEDFQAIESEACGPYILSSPLQFVEKMNILQPNLCCWRFTYTFRISNFDSIGFFYR